MHYPLLCGFPVVIQQRFDPVQFCANVEKYKITIAYTVPPVLLHLAWHPGKTSNVVSGACLILIISAVDEYDMSSVLRIANTV